jgi:hypothetical protein
MNHGTALMFGDNVKAAFVGARLAPDKTGDQDPFGNVRIPLLEGVDSQPTDEDSLRVLKQGNYYSSLIGLAITGLYSANTTALNIETSYMYANCSMKRQGDPGFKTAWDAKVEGYLYRWKRWRTCHGPRFRSRV